MNKSRLREPAHRAAEVGAVDGEDLKLVALHAAHPAGNVVGFSIGNASDGILELRQASLAFGKLVEFAERDPTFVLAAVAAEDGRDEVADHRRSQNRDGQAVQQHSDLGEQIAP